MTDSAGSFTNTRSPHDHGIGFSAPTRPTSNGCVERVQQTLLHECWKPAFARYLTPKYTGLRRDLERELLVYNTDRAHQGRLTKGLIPEQALMDRTLWS